MLSTASTASTSGTGLLVTESYSGELDTLRLQANQFNQLFDVMPAGVVIIDGDGVVVKANKTAISLFSMDLVGQAWIDVIKQAFKPRADDGHEVSLKDGRRVKLDVSSFASQAGQLILITDLTETRLLQEKLGKMEKLSALGKMVSTLAHQIRTPLSAAMLYCSNLGNADLPEEKRSSFLDKLADRLQTLEQQVNDMLLFAKSGGKQVVAVIDAQDLITEAVRGCDTEVEKANATLNVAIESINQPVVGNKNALVGAIQNLIHNALQVNSEQVCIELKAYQQDDFLHVHVLDNGSGVDLTKSDEIFEMFYTSKEQGTGLGLAVVKSVAKAHHGDVSVSNRTESGADFCLKLPLFKGS
ncbi:PAS domain-containing sensor histidine kinase [Thalassotalea aquiviva]|uniref:sensor histidine kinase n=1 Tax=Thalassotalea aquiviva TaxID=3242415 RepID=UPI00352AFFC1